MQFVFVHTSDLHIGKPFAGFDGEVAAQLRASRLSAIARVAAVARSAGAGHVLVAGDTFDREGLADEVLRSAMARFAAQSDVRWHVISGNHDADRAGGLFERLARLGLPGNVIVHREAEPVMVVPGVRLLPAPLKARRVTADPTAWMDGLASPDGEIRIGLAHGATRGFGSSGEASVLIDPGRRATAGLTYLALGDWHGTKQVAPGVWYSGTPEPDQFATNEPGAVLVVRCGGSSEPDVRRVPTAERQWLKRSLTVRDEADLSEVGREIDALGAGAGDALLELTLAGTVNLAARAAIDQAVTRLAARLLALVARLDGLETRPERQEISAFDDRQLAKVAERLAQLAGEDGHPKASAAGEALRLLYTLACKVPEARP